MNIQLILVITDPHITDFGYIGQNVAVYYYGFLEVLRH
jgi:hypothetical protein